MSSPLTALQSCTANMTFKWSGAQQRRAGRNSPDSDDETFAHALSLQLGTAITQCDTIISTVRTIAASGTDTITLSTMAATGSPNQITDIFGNTPALVKIRAFLLQHLSDASAGKGQTAQSPADPSFPATPGSSITIGAAASHPWNAFLLSTGTATLVPGASLCLIDATSNALPVVSGTSEQLKIVNADNTDAVNYRLVILGCSA